MRRKISLAIGAVGLLLVSAAPVAAGAPEFGCVPPGWQPTGEVVYYLNASPGDADWAFEVRLCRLEKFDGHVVPIRP